MAEILTSNEIHVWAVRLDYPTNGLRDLLSPDERSRAARYHFDLHRHRFICARAALRLLLGEYTNTSPLDVRFRYGPNGKPSLADTAKSDLNFNLAHADDLALIAIGNFTEIGVDVERVRWLDDFDDLVSRFFSSREAHCFQNLGSEAKPAAFFNLWTRKEALLKATGDGISNSLNRVEVTFLPGETPRFVALPENRETSDWSLSELKPATEYAAALAVKIPGLRNLDSSQIRLKCREFVPKGHSAIAQRFNFNLGAPTQIQPAPERAADNPSISILGVRFDNITIPQTLDRIEQMIATRRPHYAVTANVDFVVQAQTDIELRRIFFEAHLVLCDGTPLVWASRLLGNALGERVAGADIVPQLIELAERKQYRVFFLGAAPNSIERAVANVQSRHPKLLITGFYSPPFNQLLEMDHQEIRKRVLQAQPDLLFVSLGCPKQEKWVAMNYRALGVPVTIGVGATIDFLAGQVKRAPVWMQRSGTEWIFRLVQEPRRLYRRYSKDIWVFGLRLSAQLWHFWRAARLSSSTASRDLIGSAFGEECVVLPCVLDHKAVHAFVSELNHLTARPGDCFLDLSGVQFIDSTGIAALMKLRQQLASKAQRLVLIAPSPAVTRALAFMRLEMFFDSAGNLQEARQILAARAHESEHLVEVNRRGAFRALVWYGEITALNADDVWERTSAYIEQAAHIRETSDAPQSLVIDLSVVRFIDSSGLGLMVRVRKLARQYGLKLRFTNLQPAVLNVIQIARLEDFLMDGKPQKPEKVVELRSEPAPMFEALGK